MAEPRVIERFRKRSIWFHWIHTAAFLVLLVTGAILFLPGLGAPAAGGFTRALHRIAAVVFIAGPLIYCIINPKMSLHFLKETFTWTMEDFRWICKAPDYYFGGDESKMIPQGHINTGQKMWQFVTLTTGILFVVTGLLMWFLKDTLSPGVFQWMIVIHDIAFILAFLMLLVHIYTGSLHPRMTESLRSMWDGKISKNYARSHYSKWYDEISKDNS